MADRSGQRVAIIGGGLVGALEACFLAKRGFQVNLYESRSDIRLEETVQGRSINLALSCRGREALRAVGLEDHVVQNGIPMYARMIHDLDGSRRPIPYGTKDQYIMSVDRGRLNQLLLTAADKYSNVNIYFDHKFVSCDFDAGNAKFQMPDGTVIQKDFDAIIGCDGAFSAVRRQMMRATRIDFSQDYIPHGYMELRIPPTADDKFAIEKNYLHIWPRNTFMLIGLPNVQDSSFVMTLFMPFDIFESIKTNDDLMTFFRDKFPDSIPYIGEEALKQTFFSRTPLPLVTVKCSPYNVHTRGLIMGDAAHAMVPFYGQGMNCGFEDCLVLDDILTACNNDIGAALPEFTRLRNADAKSICDLALYNYVEMRASVNSRMFLMRKKIDSILHWLLPRTWVPLYTTVSFTRIPYRQCILNRKWQDKVLTRFMWLVLLGSAGAVLASFRQRGLVSMETAHDLMYNNQLFRKVAGVFGGAPFRR